MYKNFAIDDPFNITSITSLFFDDYKKGYYYEGEAHDFWELTFIVSGSATICVNENIYSLEKNDLLLIAPYQFHNFMCNNNDAKVIIISFDFVGKNFDTCVFHLSEMMSAKFTCIFELGESIFNVQGILVSEIKNEDALLLKKFKSNFEMFMLELEGNACKPILNTQSSAKAILYSKIIKYLYANLNNKINLNDIATACNASVSNIKYVFSYFTNDSIINYFNKLKMLKARQLLQSGLSIKEVSSILGFSEQNYFSNVFKKYTKLSPLTWLKENKNTIKQS